MNLGGPSILVAQNTSRGGSCSMPTVSGRSRTSTTPVETRPGSWVRPRSIPTATAPRKSSCSTSRRKSLLVPVAQGRRLSAQRHARGRVDQLHRHARRRFRFGDGRDDLLIAGTRSLRRASDRPAGPAAQDDRHVESKRTEAKLADLAAGDFNADGSPDVVFTDIGEQSLEIATYAGDPELLPGITFKLFERKSFRNAADTIEPRDMAIGDVDGDGRATSS